MGVRPMRFLIGLAFGLLVGVINYRLLMAAVRKAALERSHQLLGRYLLRYLVDLAAFALVFFIFRDPLVVGGTLIGLLAALVGGLWLIIRREGRSHLG